MNIAPISTSAAAAAQSIQAKEPAAVQIAAVAAERRNVTDTVEITPSRASRAAQRNNTVQTVNMQAQMMRRMAERIIKEQYSKGNHLFMLFYGNKALQLDPSLRPESFIPDYVPQEQHEAVVSAVDYYSPAQTGQRILGVAEDVAGGADALRQQPALAGVFQNAVGAAFLNVQNEAGGNLPELVQQTFEVTMRSFDALAKVPSEG
ncbi:MAG: hypothetical protein FWG72_09290 [Oscillospiraceae bacterium]|nr:hypothetical protein [Oscillospiraceae bacterium]